MYRVKEKRKEAHIKEKSTQMRAFLAQGVGFEPTWVAPNGFQDRLVMTASITLRSDVKL